MNTASTVALLRVPKFQVAILIALCLLLIAFQPSLVFSGFLGGLCCLIPTCFTLFKLQRIKTNYDPTWQWRLAISIQIQKIVLTIMLFIAIFIIYNALNIVVFLISFLICQSMYVIAPLLGDKK